MRERRIVRRLLVLLVAALSTTTHTSAFISTTTSSISFFSSSRISCGFSSPSLLNRRYATGSTSTKLMAIKSTESATEVEEVPNMNPDNPALPLLKGDYDWDAEYSADDDWLSNNVPGKITVNEIELATQVTELTKLEDAYRKVRKDKEYTAARIIGFVPQAETYNGRAAMFFLVVGLLTEYWTGISIPGQIEEMARVGGFIGPDF